MKRLLQYLRIHWKSTFSFFLSAAIFACVFVLYNLPAQAVGYAALLSLCACLPLLVLDFRKMCTRHRALQEAKKTSFPLVPALPPAQNLLEADYQELLENLHKQIVELSTQSDLSHSETIAYYTMWAHQIKTPIAAMHLLLQTEDSPDLHALKDSLFQIEEYVEMVLSYLRLDSDTSDLVLQQYSLDAIVRQAIRKYAPLFIRRKIALHYQPIRLQVLTDKKWLLFVIQQILSNALKYTPAGSVTISLKSPATLVIADTGIGIVPEDLPRIGQKGFTGHNGRIDQKSTGIGLYLCRRTLDKLSHSFSITSQVGKGTAVSIDLQRKHLFLE